MIESYVRQFETAAANGGGHGPVWLTSMRRAAIDAFRNSGFPSSKDEEWRFTAIAPIARTVFSRAPVESNVGLEDLEPFLFGHREWPRLVFLNGRFALRLSVLPTMAGIRLRSLADAVSETPAVVEGHFGKHVPLDSTPFTALNTALNQDGALLEVDPGVTLASPIHLLFLTTGDAEGSAIHPRAMITVGTGSRVQIIESYAALGDRLKYWTNAVTEVAVGEGAWVEHSRVQRESEAAFHIAFSQVSQGQSSHYRSFSFSMGGAIARHNLHTRLNAPGTETLLYGLYFGREDQVVDNHTTIFHDQPDCRSWEVYKGILDDRAHAVFNGKIFVKPEAQRTDAKQTNRALLLSDSARIDTKPQLEIFADDVKCTHGATIGQLDPLASFYLRSRGVPKAAAERLLVYAFAGEVLAEISAEPVRAVLDGLIHERLGGVR